MAESGKAGRGRRFVDALIEGEREEIAERLVAIVQSSDDAIISKDLSGIITSWNAGAGRIFGYSAEETIGQPITILIPPDHLDEEPAILERIRRGERVEHYETVRLRKDGTPIPISLTVSPVKNRHGVIVGASKIARDISRQKRIELQLARQSRRLEQLNRAAKLVSRDLDLDRIAQTVIDIATELTGAKFGSFFYRGSGEPEEGELPHSLCGIARGDLLIPRDMALLQSVLEGSAGLRSDDIASDPRFDGQPPYGMPNSDPPVVSYLGVPVIGRNGTLLGALFFGHDQPAIFQEEAEEIAVGIAGHAAMAIDNARLHRSVQQELEQRRKAEEIKDLLLQEIQHRVKNTLGTVLAVAAQTFKTAAQAERKAFEARIQALARAHALLIQSNWNGTTVRDAVEQAIEPFQVVARDRLALDGPAVELDAARSFTLAMVLHELATNAVKYGALSCDGGTVAISWSLAEGGRLMRLVWQERGGPAVGAPTRKGFGSTLIENALRGTQGRARLHYDPQGVICDIEMAL